MTQKIPPPPQFAGPQWHSFNRWLIELTSILEASGGVSPDSIPGYTALQNDVDALSTTVGGQATTIAALQFQVLVLTSTLAAANASITTLSARGELLFGTGAPAAGLGKVNDWYGDTAGAAGARVWIKKAVGAWTPFPF